MPPYGASRGLFRINRNNVAYFEKIRLQSAGEKMSVFDCSYSHLSADDWNVWTERWRSDRAFGVIANEKASSCGFAVGVVDENDRKCVKIAGLWVVPQRRRCGIGRELVVAVNKWAAWFGASSVQVLIASDNSPAAAFFADLGFVKTVQTKQCSAGNIELYSCSL